MASSMSSTLEGEKLMMERLSSSLNSTPKRVIAKKHKLPRGHYTREFLLSDHQEMSYNQPPMPLPFGTTSHDPISSSKTTVFGKQDLKKYENSYTPIRIRDLVPGVVYGERILYAKILVESFIIASLHTVIEDESNRACKLCVYNLLKENEGQFAKGTKLAILNPYYKKSVDGLHLMRVDNPMEVIIIQSPVAPGDSTPALLPIQHKERGNKLFKDRKFTEALQAYSQAIMGDKHDPLFYSNRSLCYSRLKQFESALADALTAASINPEDPKFKYRACMAWSGLGSHRKAVEILNKLIQSSQDNTATLEFQDRLTVEKTYLSQQAGEINLKGIEELVLAGIPVQMADFVGPLELKRSRVTGCAERGLFATRDIKRGEIIHVSKAAVFLNDFIPRPSDSIEVGPNAVSPPFRALVSKLIQEMNRSKLCAQRVLNLVEDERFSKNTPFYTDINVYTDKGYDLIKDLPCPEFSIENIRHISVNKGISTVLNGSHNACDVSSNAANLFSGAMKFGLWFIPSLLNHSCTGNIVRVVKGEVCLLKVFKDVKAGEELLISVFDSSFYMSLGDRKKSLKQLRGYVCNCMLCKYEKEPNITPILARVSTLFNQVSELWSKHAVNSTAPPRGKYREYVMRALKLAEELGLDSQTFCGPLWSTFINLLCIFEADKDDQLFLYENIESYLSELEIYHQYSYWTNYVKFCMNYFGPFNMRTMKAAANSAKLEKLFLWTE